MRKEVDFHCPCGEKDPEKYHSHWDKRYNVRRTKKNLCKVHENERHSVNQKKRSKEVANYDRNRNLKANYGITVDDYDKLLIQQKYVCACCGDDWFGADANRHWPVDHDHVTGEMRGIICLNCNVMLGMANDTVERLQLGIEYLERSSVCPVTPSASALS